MDLTKYTKAMEQILREKHEGKIKDEDVTDEYIMSKIYPDRKPEKKQSFWSSLFKKRHRSK